MAITVTIDEAEFLEMLVERVKYWTDDADTIELFEQYYDNMVYGGCFEGSSRSIAEIVDNDYVNNTSITYREEYESDREKFLKDSIRKYIEENKQCYDENEHADWVSDLKAHIEDLKEEAPEWDNIECGENNMDFLEGSYIEAKTDVCLLVTW